VSDDLSESELERYAAQVERIGVEAQLRLKAARAIVIGAGPAGSAAAAELVSRGVGYVAVVDGAAVTLGDLCGQAMLYTPDVGANRAEAVVAKLGVLNPHVHAESYPVDVDDANAEAILSGHDVALDCVGGIPAEAADVGVRGAVAYP
jgi:adenylyltransferase/sulfurtransferase